MATQEVQDCGDGRFAYHNGPFTWEPRLVYYLSKAGVVDVGAAMNLPARTIWEMFHEHQDYIREQNGR